jgi:hypothetical protein
LDISLPPPDRVETGLISSIFPAPSPGRGTQSQTHGYLTLVRAVPSGASPQEPGRRAAGGEAPPINDKGTAFPKREVSDRGASRTDATNQVVQSPFVSLTPIVPSSSRVLLTRCPSCDSVMPLELLKRRAPYRDTRIPIARCSVDHFDRAAKAG